MVVDPFTGLLELAGQLLHCVWADLEYVWARHIVSWKELGHLMPAVHCLHAKVPFLTQPAVTQVQLSMWNEPATEVERLGQVLTVVSPGQKEPTGQGMQLN